MATPVEQLTVKEKIKIFQGPFKQNDKPLFKEPLQFIYTDEKTGKLRCDEKTMELLSQVDQPLNVVAMTGLYRTGKSYLLNMLAREKGGFKTGHKIQACTKGIWIWCRHHPTQEGQVLVLLDVEGFGDLEKVNRDEDNWLFTLATLLSSTLVYNNRGTLDSYALDRLKFLEQMDSMIQVSKKMEEDKRLLDLDFFFPSLVITLRDFSLELVNKEDKAITPDEYLEDLLVQKKGQGKDVEKYNKIRLLIRRFFKKRKCFVFIQPCGPKAELEKLSESEIEPDFLKSVRDLCKYISVRKPMQLKSGREITGRMFANLAKHYVRTIGKNRQPSILKATKYMARKENKATVDAASDVYKKEMQQCLAKIGDIVPKDEALVGFHEICLSKSLEHFKKLIAFDDSDVYQKKAKRACRKLLDKFKGICDQDSENSCRDAIARLNKRVETKLEAGTYNCESGYDDYIQDINWIVRQYTGMTGLGSKSREILQGYLDNKDGEEEMVYQMVVNAQKGKAGKGTQVPFQERASGKIGDLSKSVKRSDSFRESLKVKVDKMEIDMNQLLEERHAKEKKTIQANYLDSINFKIIELERQRAEKAGETELLKQINNEMTYLQKIFEYAKHIDGTTEVATEDGPGEELAPDETDRIGVCPDTAGVSQENLSQERKISGKPKKKWCKVQ